MDGYSLSADASVDGSSDPYAAAVLASHPVAYYRLDETSGTVAHDSSGNGNDCTYEGAVVFGAAGNSPLRRAVRLTGQAASGQPEPAVSCPGNVAAFSGTQPFSFEGWFAPDSIPTDSYPTLFSRFTAGPNNTMRNGYTAFITEVDGGGPSQGIASCNIYSGDSITCFVGALSIPCGTSAYSFIALTYDGATLSAYLNGQLGNFYGTTTCSGFPSVPGATFVIGAYVSATACSSCVFVGAVEDVAIYDRPLSANEVQGHYKAASNP